MRDQQALTSVLQAVTLLIAAIIIAVLLSGCESGNNEAIKASAPSKKHLQQTPSTSTETNNNHLLIVHQEAETLFSALKSQCTTFNQSLVLFIKDKTESNLNAAYQDWQNCHNAYINTRLLRALTKELDILHPELDTNLTTNNSIRHNIHSKLDKYPMLPGYLDSVSGYPYSGLMHSDMELSYAALLEEHQLGDEAYVAIGFHPIEFMLIGENANISSRLKDYLSNGEKRHDKLIKRRSNYLALLGQILSEDIQRLTDAWAVESGFYLSQLRLVSPQRLHFVLINLVDVEIQAIDKIQETRHATPSMIIHDTDFTLNSRKEIALRIKKKISPLTQDKQEGAELVTQRADEP